MLNNTVRLMSAALVSLTLSAPVLAECEVLFASPDINFGTLQGEQAKQPLEKEVALNVYCDRSGRPQVWFLLPSRLEGVAVKKVVVKGQPVSWETAGEGCRGRERECTRWLSGGQRVTVTPDEPLQAQELLTISLQVKIVPRRKGEAVTDATRIETGLEAGALL